MVWIWVSNTVRTHSFHQSPIRPPESRPSYHVMLARIVDTAVFSSACTLVMHIDNLAYPSGVRFHLFALLHTRPHHTKLT